MARFYMEPIPDKLRKMILYDQPYIKTPLKKSVQLVFADLTASGRPSPVIERAIEQKVLPYYSNTHSNAYCGILMKNMVKESKGTIRKHLKVDKTKKIIFAGSGMTGAINHLINCLNIPILPKLHVFTSMFEHHSNYLPWIELQKHHNNIQLYTIPINDNHEIDLLWLQKQLETINTQNEEHVCIVSVTACSNVTGIHTKVDQLWDMINESNKVCKRECKIIKSNLLFLDYACSAPYVKIDGNKCDALFFSPHKFLGGQSTPGILVANKSLFLNDAPYEPGGGCVQKVCSTGVTYSKDIEVKESAGTPNIVGIIRVGMVLRLWGILEPKICGNEGFLTKYVHGVFRGFVGKYPQLQVMMLGEHMDNRLPIVCFDVKGMHYNLVVVLLNDLFGIQTRGGVSCTGLLAEWVERKYGMKGWCRVSFSWLQSKEEVDYILRAIEYVVAKGEGYKGQYKYDKGANLYRHV